MTNTARNGRAREHRVRDLLISRGWEVIARAAGSRGPADLVMAHLEHGAALVQVGTAKSKRLGPTDRDRLCHAAELCSALPLLATSGPGAPTRFWLVTRDKPATWTEWSP